METKQVMTGCAIIIVDRGYVYVGMITVDEKYCVIENAYNIRRWGTTKGLGELAMEGPKSETVLDKYGTVRIPMRAVISILDTDISKWDCLK